MYTSTARHYPMERGEKIGLQKKKVHSLTTHFLPDDPRKRAYVIYTYARLMRFIIVMIRALELIYEANMVSMKLSNSYIENSFTNSKEKRW